MRWFLDWNLTDSKVQGKQKVLPRTGWFYELNFLNRDLSIDRTEYPWIIRAQKDIQQGIKDYFFGAPDYTHADVKASLLEHVPIENVFNRNFREGFNVMTANLDVLANKIRKEPGSTISKVIDLVTGTRTEQFDSTRGIKNKSRVARDEAHFVKKGNNNGE